MTQLIDQALSGKIGEFVLQFAALENQFEEFAWQSATHLGKGRSILKKYPLQFSRKTSDAFEAIEQVLTKQPIYQLVDFESVADLKELLVAAQEARNAICHGNLMEVKPGKIYLERTIRADESCQRLYKREETEITEKQLIKLTEKLRDGQLLSELLIQCLNWDVDGWSQSETNRLPNAYMRSTSELRDLKMKNAGYWPNTSGGYDYIGRHAVRKNL